MNLNFLSVSAILLFTVVVVSVVSVFFVNTATEEVVQFLNGVTINIFELNDENRDQ